MSENSPLLLDGSDEPDDGGMATAAVEQAAARSAKTATKSALKQVSAANAAAAQQSAVAQSAAAAAAPVAVEVAKKSTDATARFADYFVICGLDLDTGLEPDRFAGDNLHCSPLDRAYKSKPLAHYPEHVAWNPFDAHGICMLSLPQGLRFRTQKHCTEPQFHAFATTREDGKRCHGFSLIFYEEVRNRQICSAMHTLQSMYITELSSGPASPQPAGVRRCKDSPVSRSLPRHFKLAAHTPAAALSYYDVAKDKLFVAKSISLVCQVAYAHVAKIFLTNLYKCLPRQPGPSLSLESYVYNILYEVLIPQPGRSTRIYLPPLEPQLPPIPTILQRPGLIDELPLMDFPLRQLFTHLGCDCVIQLFTCVLLENQVLLKSADYQRLMLVGECITSLLHPFAWPHVYAPILPAALHHFLDAPVPFVMGLHADSADSAASSGGGRMGSEATLCYVDIDRRHIQMPEELPLFPHRAELQQELAAALDRFNVPHADGGDSGSGAYLVSQGNGGGGGGGGVAGGSPASANILSARSQLHRPAHFDPMSASCTLPSGQLAAARRKHSLHDMLDWDRCPPPIQHPQPPSADYNAATPLQNGNGSSSAAQEAEIVDRMPPVGHSRRQPLSAHEQYCDDLRLNNTLREIVLNRFVQMFAAYEHFVIWPNQRREEWLSNRESLQNFDKAAFLSDQQRQHRPFLSRFLETQMFATLVDNKIMTVWDGEFDANLRLFDNRIKILRKRHGGDNIIRVASYEPCILARETQRFLDKRLAGVDMEVAPPSEILPNRPAYFRSFPVLDKSVLNQESASRGNSLRRVKSSSATAGGGNGAAKWRTTKEIAIDGKPPTGAQRAAGGQMAAVAALSGPADMSPALIAQANWTFVEKLLKDCKSKTKRMLLEKMGTEAIAMGSGGGSGGGGNEVSVMGVEENTMIASLCDLLEKCWSHGLQNKQGKSGLWSHLQAYLEFQELQSGQTIGGVGVGGGVGGVGGLGGGAGKLGGSGDGNYLTPECTPSPHKKEQQQQQQPLKQPQSPFRFLPDLVQSVLRPGRSAAASPSASAWSTNCVDVVVVLPAEKKGRRSRTANSNSLCATSSYRCAYYPGDLSSLAIEPESPSSPQRGRSKSRDRKSLGPEQLRPLPESLEFDIKNILAMSDVKTHIGYARAWVRLALEKKLLSRHLRTLLSDGALLKQLYKRSAFVRCEDEKEQFLYHLLTLNAVDYFCFTNTYPTTKLPYRVVIFPSKKPGAATTSANVWVAISGTLAETKQVATPRGTFEFVFHHKNLGILTSLRIGHDNSGPSAKWMVEHVVVRNEVSGHTYKFPCGRWLGRGIDDGSTERLLVGQLVPRTVDSEELVEACRTPPRARSPSLHRPEIRPSDIQHQLGDCVNAIVKWHYRPSRDRDTGSLTTLLCGEDGLAKGMENAFLCGFKSQRLFGRNLYIWDYFVKVKEHFEQCLAEDANDGHRPSGSSSASDSPPTSTSSPESPAMYGSGGHATAACSPAVRHELGAIWRCYVHLMDEIHAVTHTLGKDGKFQLFICLSLREHLLHRMLGPMAATRATQDMYEEQSFMRKKGLLTFLRQILEPLDEFHIVLENSITQGIPSQC